MWKKCTATLETNWQSSGITGNKMLPGQDRKQ
jgi:hypothetical protein